jgi:transcriptional regulator with XRE-family HTH domain
MNFALKFALVRSGRSQREVSIESKIPETRLSAIVRGRAEPTPAERCALACVLNQHSSDLFPQEAGRAIA